MNKSIDISWCPRLLQSWSAWTLYKLLVVMVWSGLSWCSPIWLLAGPVSWSILSLTDLRFPMMREGRRGLYLPSRIPRNPYASLSTQCSAGISSGLTSGPARLQHYQLSTGANMAGNSISKNSQQFLYHTNTSREGKKGQVLYLK